MRGCCNYPQPYLGSPLLSVVCNVGALHGDEIVDMLAKPVLLYSGWNSVLTAFRANTEVLPFIGALSSELDL
jgi:hypothetical protein